MLRWLPLLLALLPACALAAPPASVAVAFDRAHLRTVLAEGEADPARHRPARADDPVRIASISKLVTALGVMRDVDDRDGARRVVEAGARHGAQHGARDGHGGRYRQRLSPSFPWLGQGVVPGCRPRVGAPIYSACGSSESVARCGARGWRGT